jgi:hypothetical protein
MSAVAAPHRTPSAAEARRPACAGSPPFGDRATLEAIVLSAWEGVVVEGRCACPVCGGLMVADGAGAGCRSCGSSLS